MRKAGNISIQDFIPPVVYKVVNRLGIQREKHRKFGWFGDYATWQAAQTDSTGYDSGLILEKVKTALLKVKNGEAAFERDSVLFDKIEYSWPLLSALMWIAAQKRGILNVIDFGGSLGSTYFQNRFFLSDLQKVQWSIVEQKNFVACGKHFFENEQLSFYSTLAECFAQKAPNTILLSSVLPYLESPYELLAELLEYKFEFIVLDKMPFIKGSKDRITIQRVPSEIYEASYPAWFFSEEKFVKFMSSTYTIHAEFNCQDIANIPSCFKGYIMRLRS